jgi:hypothetical protein
LIACRPPVKRLPWQDNDFLLARRPKLTHNVGRLEMPHVCPLMPALAGLLNQMQRRALRDDGRHHDPLEPSVTRSQPSIMNPIPTCRPSASAPYAPHRELDTARERILRALELGRRGQVLRGLGEYAPAGSRLR